MRGRLRTNAVALCGAAVGLAIIAWLGLVGFAWTDYDLEASRANLALVHGDVIGFLRLCPAYGGSLVLRAPFALVPGLWGGGEDAVYRAVAVPCLLAAGGLGVWLVAQMRAAGAKRLDRAVVLALCVAQPVAEAGMELGHAEELLSAVLVVAAVLAAKRDRSMLAAVCLGLAAANKPWALIAAGPVLLALPRASSRPRAAITAALVAAALTAPVMLAGSAQLSPTHSAAAGTGPIFQPWQAWWFLGASHHAVIHGANGQVKFHYRAAPHWLSPIPHPLILLVAGIASLAWLVVRRRGAARDHDELLLLALVLHLRCLLDPWNTMYYALPFLMALLVWEALARRGPPLFALLATVVIWQIFDTLPLKDVHPDIQAAAYLAFAVPTALLLAARVYAPGLFQVRGRADAQAGAGGPQPELQPAGALA